jgi:hypothetical protein
MATQYTWSSDNELFKGRFDEPHDALIDAIESGAEVGSKVYIAELVPVSTSQLVSADQIIEQARCMAGDLAGEAGEDYLSVVSTEQEQELEALVAAWMERVEPVCFWGVEHSFAVIVSPADFAASERGKQA